MERLIEFFTQEYKIYFILALAGSFIFLIQMILALFGAGETDVDMDTGVDIDGDGILDYDHADAGLGDFHLVSFRTVVAFVTFFGWGGFIAYKLEFGHLGCFVSAFASGLLMMVATAGFLYFLLSLQQSGNITPEQIIGCIGTVYFTVPEGRVDTGKVTVTVSGCTIQVSAVADEQLPSGTSVKVAGQIDGQRYLVKKL